MPNARKRNPKAKYVWKRESSGFQEVSRKHQGCVNSGCYGKCSWRRSFTDIPASDNTRSRSYQTQQCQQYLWILSVNDPTSIPMMTMIMITLKKCMPMVLSQKAF